MSTSSKWLALTASLSALALAGCGVSLQQMAATTAIPGVAIRGHVHGGVYPIQGATIRLMETQSNGYGGRAKALLQTTSDRNGYFTFPDTGWTCDAGQYAYVTVTSGHTSSFAVNNNVGQIGVIGACSQTLANVSEIDGVNVFVSEVSTIAAAYTLGNFITIDNTNAATGQQIINISAPANNNATSGVCTFTGAPNCIGAGLAHGFENAYNLVDSVTYYGSFPTGQARLAPPTNGFGYVPQAMINTLANILQSCVDSPGGKATLSSGVYVTDGSRCGDLFAAATPPSGVAPTNTLQVAMNMAKYPANNVSTLFALQPRAVFFTPTLNQVPNDLSLSVFYLTEAFGAYTGNLTNPVALTLDANDDAFVLATSAAGSANTQTAVLGISTNGAVLFAGPLDTTHLYPTSLAVDTLDNLWFTNNDPNTAGNGALLKANAQTGVISVGTALPYAAGLAVDRYNNVWTSIASTTANSIQEFTNATLLGGTVLPMRKSNVLGTPLTTLAIDGNQHVWSVGLSGSNASAVVWPNTGSLLAPLYTNNISSQALNAAKGFGIAANAANEVFFPLANQVNDGTYNNGLITNNLGTFSGASASGARYNVPNQAQVDGAGSLFWTDLEPSGQVFQFVPNAGGNMNQGSLYSLLPCYPVNGVCYVPAVANARGMSIDSSGTLWYVADATYYGSPIGVLIQTFGVGAPTWPQLSYGKPGVKPQ